jgi:hypothetical protein
MLLGQTFRQNQQTKNQKLSTNFMQVSQMVQQAAIQLNTAGGTPIAPGATLPQLAAAGALLIQAAQLLQQMGQAINDFETTAGKNNSYLSQKNRSD